MVLFLFTVKEFYPFSHYPMYSGLNDDVDLYFVRDSEKQPVPVLSAYGIKTSRVKKMFNTELGELLKPRRAKRSEATPEEMREAGDRVLAYLLDQMSEGQKAIYPHDDIELVRIMVTMRDGKFTRTEVAVAKSGGVEVAR
jgi:hypothetical protein